MPEHLTVPFTYRMEEAVVVTTAAGPRTDRVTGRRVTERLGAEHLRLEYAIGYGGTLEDCGWFAEAQLQRVADPLTRAEAASLARLLRLAPDAATDAAQLCLAKLLRMAGEL